MAEWAGTGRDAWTKATVIGLAVIGFVVLIAPIVMVIWLSFTSSETLRFPPPGYSFRWYAALLSPEDSGQLHVAARNSLVVAVMAMLFGVLLAVPAALGLRRLPARRAKGLDFFFTSPLILPLLAYGLAALMFFSWIGLSPSLGLMVIGHVVVTTPLVLRTTYASALQLDNALVESSEVLGASRLYTFRRITLPLLMPGVMAGAFLAFVFSFDNVPVSLFLSTATTEMLPIRLFGMLEVALDVRVAAVAGVLITATLFLLALAERLFGVSRHV